MRIWDYFTLTYPKITSINNDTYEKSFNWLWWSRS